MYRKSKLSDCSEIYDLVCELEGKRLPLEKFTKIYNQQIDDRRHYCLVYEYDNMVVGMLNLRFEEQLHHAECIAEVMEFAIKSAYRGKGIGKEMFAAACRLAKEMECTQIEVACNQLRENTHRFYLREGMQNFHFKFSKALIETDVPENKIGN